MNNVLAIIDLHNDGKLNFNDYQSETASTTFMGRYSFIDSVLSNLTNSGIDDIAILVKNHFRSISKHIGNDSTYLRNTKTGFLNILINEKNLSNDAFNTDVNNLKENDYIFYDSSNKYVLVCPIKFICNINYQKVIEEHIKSNRIVSVVYAPSTTPKDYIGCDHLTIDSLNGVQKFEKISGDEETVNVSLATYVINLKFMKDLIMKADKISALFSLEDVFKYISQYIEHLNCIRFDGYFRKFSNLKDYYKNSFEVLDNRKFYDELIKDNITYLTSSHNSQPVSYGAEADVKNSLIANGCIINGTCHHSILARDILIEEGATVENCILFTHTIVKSGVHLKNLVANKRCVFKTQKEVFGDENDPLYIPRYGVI